MEDEENRKTNKEQTAARKDDHSSMSLQCKPMETAAKTGRTGKTEKIEKIEKQRKRMRRGEEIVLHMQIETVV